MISKKIGQRATRQPNSENCLFQNLEDDKETLGCQAGFIDDLWQDQSPNHSVAFGFLAFKELRTGRWIEKPIRAHRSKRDKAAILEAHPRWDYDQYFCPNLFSCAKRKAEFALPTRLGWCDMDDSNPDDYYPLPSLVWETSPRRYQALWAWDVPHTSTEAEAYSRTLAYRYGGDRNGWSVTKMVRLIGSVNHKPHYDEPFVKLVRRVGVVSPNVRASSKGEGRCFNLPWPSIHCPTPPRMSSRATDATYIWRFVSCSHMTVCERWIDPPAYTVLSRRSIAQARMPMKLRVSFGVARTFLKSMGRTWASSSQKSPASSASWEAENEKDKA